MPLGIVMLEDKSPAGIGKMKMKKWYLGIIGLVLLAYVLSSIDIGKLFQTLFRINLAIFAIAILLEIAIIILKGIKYVFVVKAHNKSSQSILMGSF